MAGARANSGLSRWGLIWILPIAGDSPEAKTRVAELLAEMDIQVVDFGKVRMPRLSSCCTQPLGICVTRATLIGSPCKRPYHPDSVSFHLQSGRFSVLIGQVQSVGVEVIPA